MPQMTFRIYLHFPHAQGKTVKRKWQMKQLMQMVSHQINQLLHSQAVLKTTVLCKFHVSKL